MKIQIRILLMMVVWMLIQGPGAFGQDVTSVHLVCEEWADYTNKDGSGVYWEIVKKVFEPAGIRVKTEVMPWNRANHLVMKGRAHAIVGDYFYKDKAGKAFLYPSWHISVEDPIVIVFKKGSRPDWDQKGMADFAGKTVGWILGYDFKNKAWFNSGFKPYGVKTVSQGLKMISVGRLDAMIDYSSHIRHIIKENGMDYELKTVELGEKLFLKFSNSPESKKLIPVFDSRMTELAESGEIEKIFEKWGFDKSKFGKERYSGK